MPATQAVETSARLLDRLIRSRSWIVLVAFALIGIVAMQLWLLKLNGGIGRAIEHEGYMQRANAALAAENSAMSAGDLVEQQAAAAGMSILAPGKLVFLHTHPGADERLAAARLAQPVQTPSETSTASTSTASSESSAASGPASTASSESSAASGSASTASTESSAASGPASTASTESSTPAAPPSTGTETPTAGNEPATSPSPQTTPSETQG